MTVKVPVLGIVILIFVLHTIVTHLLNWMFRESTEDRSEGLLVLAIALTILEGLGCIVLLTNYLG
jgi:uncharacterized membrane protein YidH (DUF202 family)